MTNLVVRQAEAADIDCITELDRLCFSVPWSKDSITKEITENDIALYVVAQIDDAVVGYAGLWAVVGEGHITNVGVHPDYRQRGIGEALVAVMIDFSKRYEVTSYTLEVRPSNKAAIHLYEKMGFMSVGERKKYYEDNDEDAIIMWRTEG